MHAVVWPFVYPAAEVWIGGNPLSLELVLTGMAIAVVVFVFAFWLDGRRTDRMERQARAVLSRFDNLDETRRHAERYD